MRAFEQEKQFLLGTVDNDPTVFADVRLRLPRQYLVTICGWIWGARSSSYTTSVAAIRPAIRWYMCPEQELPGRG